MYKHPFRWQHDVRTIFHNAFLYHPQGSPIWQSAAELTIAFENLLKERVAVNPYAVFRVSPAPLSAESAQSPLAGVDSTSAATSTQPLVSLSALTPGSVNPPSSLATTGSTFPQLQPTSSSTSNEHLSVVALRPAASTAQTSTAKLKKAVVPPGVRVKENGSVTYTADCAGTPLGIYYTESPLFSALPPPCPVPAAQLTETKQTGLQFSQAQRRNILLRFKELDVAYRKALLDLVRDELGIHPKLCAMDIRYLPDLQLLPPIKTRQFFLYMKALLNQQKTAQESLRIPSTLPRILSWEIKEDKVSQDPKTALPAALPSFNLLTEKTKFLQPAKTAWSPMPTAGQSSGESDKESEKESGSSSSDSESESSSESDGAGKHNALPRGAAMPWKPSMPDSKTVFPFASATSARYGHPPSHNSYSSPPPPFVGAAGGKQKPVFAGPPGLGNLMQPHRGPAAAPQPIRGLGLWRPGGGTQHLQSSPWGRPMSTATSGAAVSSTETPSCWGEWKAKVMQEDLQSKGRVSAELQSHKMSIQNVRAASERESRAEKADAEI